MERQEEELRRARKRKAAKAYLKPPRAVAAPSLATRSSSLDQSPLLSAKWQWRRRRRRQRGRLGAAKAAKTATRMAMAGRWLEVAMDSRR